MNKQNAVARKVAMLIKKALRIRKEATCFDAKRTIQSGCE
jgi:hypothetical protein